MTDIKLFVPVLYLYKGNAVKGLSDFTSVSSDILKYVFSFYEKDADALIVYSLSETEEDAKKDYEILSLICELCPLKIWTVLNTFGHIAAEHLIDAGCEKIMVPVSDFDNNILLKMTSNYMASQLVAMVDSEEEYENIKEVLGGGFSAIALTNPHIFKNIISSLETGVILFVPDISLDKIVELMKNEKIIGLSGTAINANIDELSDIKLFCIENDVMIRKLAPKFSWDDLKKNSDGMVPVIVQDYKTNEVLMCAYMNEESYYLTLKRHIMTYYSRSRNELWLKGDTSGHYQYVTELWADCDMDTILAKVYQVGAACHTGSYSCFFNRIDA